MSVRSRALFEGPFAAVLGVTGGAAVAVGAVLVFRAPSQAQPATHRAPRSAIRPARCRRRARGVLP